MLRVLDMAEDLGWKAGLPAGVCPAECACFMADLRSSLLSLIRWRGAALSMLTNVRRRNEVPIASRWVLLLTSTRTRRRGRPACPVRALWWAPRQRGCERAPELRAPHCAQLAPRWRCADLHCE